MRQTELTPKQREGRRLQRQPYGPEHREPIPARRRSLLSASQKTIGEYCFHTIERIQQNCPEKVERLLEQYPFEGFASQCLRRQLRHFRVYPSQARYDDCYDAGIMAYLYAIHRCAYMDYSHVEAYITKVIRIYLTCALIAFPEARDPRRESGLREPDRPSYARIQDSMYAVGAAGISANPRHLCHIRQMLRYAVALMDETLTDREKQIVLLHCGFGPTKSVVGFSRLASLFSLKDGEEAKKAYQRAIIKTRRAIPGSAFERWIITYHQVYHLRRCTALRIEPTAPVPDWDGEEAEPLDAD